MNLAEHDYANTNNKMPYNSNYLNDENDIRRYSMTPYSLPIKSVDRPHPMLCSASGSILPPKEPPQDDPLWAAFSEGLSPNFSYDNASMLRSDQNSLESGKMLFSATGGEPRRIKKRRKTTVTTTVSPADRKKELRKRKVTKTTRPTASFSSTRRKMKRKRTTVSTDS